MVCPQGQTYRVCPAFNGSKEIRLAPLTAVNEERLDQKALEVGWNRDEVVL